MELSRKRIDDAPELDVHSSRFVTVTVTRVCASAWANVHHTLVSVWRGGRWFREQFPDVAQPFGTAEVDFHRHASHALLTSFLKRSAKGFTSCPALMKAEV
jgi:hypothetical protein